MSSFAIVSPRHRRSARPAVRWPPWFRLTVGAFAAAGLAYLAREAPTEAVAPEAEITPVEVRAPPSTWQPVAHPRSSFVLDAPHLAGLPRSVDARRHADGGREEVLRFGLWEEKASHLHLAVQWPGREVAPAASFFVDLARRAAEAGYGVARSTQPSTMASRFGSFETADVTLSNAVERPCIAFRLKDQEAALRLFGWFCAAPSRRPPGQAQLLCLIERLTLAPTADDLASRILFAQADQRHSEGCDTPEPRTAAPPTEARKGSSSHPRPKARGAGSASRDNRG